MNFLPSLSLQTLSLLCFYEPVLIVVKREKEREVLTINKPSLEMWKADL